VFKIFIGLSLLITYTPSVLAQEFGGVPSINSIPFFTTVLARDNPKYTPAASAAQEALFLQIGLTQQVNLITGFLNKEATNKATYVVENYTPFTSKQVFFIAAVAYSAGVKKQITQKFRNPMFKSVNHIVTVSQDRGELGISIPF
jgi:hypothetical protein